MSCDILRRLTTRFSHILSTAAIAAALLSGSVVRADGGSTADDSADGPVLGAPATGDAAEVRVARRERDAIGTGLLDVDRDRVGDVAPATPLERQLVPVEPQREFSAEMADLRNRVRRCLDEYYRRPLSTATYTPWGTMHALLPYGVDSNVSVNGRQVNAIGWLCWNQPCRGQRLMYLAGGRVHASVGVGVQGHQGQFLSMLAQSRVPASYGLKVNGEDFTVRDLVETEMRTCRAGTELTFKLIALAHYLESDAKWRNDLGEEWDIPRLIREELKQPINGVACGGTHRMTGFAYAVRKREQRGETVDGEWSRADKYVKDYHKYLYSLQNPNGSFSTNWFRGRGDSGDTDRYLQTTGHLLEFLVFSLPQEDLQDGRVVRAVDFLTNLMLRHNTRQWEVGPLGHALHALSIYDERVFGTKPGHRTSQLAKRPAQ